MRMPKIYLSVYAELNCLYISQHYIRDIELARYAYDTSYLLFITKLHVK